MRRYSEYFKQFGLRGLVAMGFGSVVLSVIYLILGLSGVIDRLAWSEVVLGYLTITALAFLTGGITVVYQIEELPLSLATTLHGFILYIGYALVYVTNNWLKDGIIPFLVFTGIFIAGYILVWLVIYLITNKGTKNINNKIKSRAE